MTCCELTTPKPACKCLFWLLIFISEPYLKVLEGQTTDRLTCSQGCLTSGQKRSRESLIKVFLNIRYGCRASQNRNETIELSLITSRATQGCSEEAVISGDPGTEGSPRPLQSLEEERRALPGSASLQEWGHCAGHLTQNRMQLHAQGPVLLHLEEKLPVVPEGFMIYRQFW